MTLLNEDFIQEPSRKIPVARRSDVLVVGGGPAGVGAALVAARSGAETVLIERYGFLGGMWTMGLLNPFIDHKNKGGIIQEIVDRMDAAGYMHRKTRRDCFNNEYMKYLLDTMMIEAGVDIALHRFATDVVMDEDRICGVITESKSGRAAFLADVVIDCTGDGDVSYRAGVPCEKGRPGDGLMQPATLFFMLGNAKFELPDKPTAYSMITNAATEAGLDYEIPYKEPAFMPLPLTDHVLVQLTHVYGVDGTNADDLTRAEIEARKQTHDALELFRNHISAFAGVELVQTGVQIGIRETRRIKGLYELTEEDLLEGRAFPDGICWVEFGIDIHSLKPPWEKGAYEELSRVTEPCQIPYRSLLPVGVEGLIVAGRCISGTHEAHASYRVTGDCVAMGQAAGTAAAMAVEKKISPSEIDGTALVARLKKDGVLL